MVFDVKQKYYFQDPGRFGQDASSDPDLDPTLDGDDELTPESIAPDVEDQGPSAYERINERIANAREKIDRAKELRNQRAQAKQPGQGLKPATDKPLLGRSPGAKSPIAGDIAAATRQKAAQATTKAATQAAGNVIKKGAAQVGARAAQAVAGASAAGGPVGWAITAGIIAAQAVTSLFKTKVFRSIALGTIIAVAGFLFILGFAFFALVRSGLNGAREEIPITPANAAAITTKAQSVTTFVENIDTITRDTEALLNRNTRLSGKSAQIKDLLGQLRALRNEIEPTASSNSQATAEQLQKYAAIVVQIKQLVEPDRKALSDQILAHAQNGNIRFATSVCPGVKRDVQNLSITANTMKVILAINEYGAANGKTYLINCLVSGHRKYVGKSPQNGYPYCNDTREYANFIESKHCSGQAVDINGTDQNLMNYLNSRKSELGISKAFVEDRFHSHVEVTK